MTHWNACVAVARSADLVLTKEGHGLRRRSNRVGWLTWIRPLSAAPMIDGAAREPLATACGHLSTGRVTAQAMGSMSCNAAVQTNHMAEQV